MSILDLFKTSNQREYILAKEDEVIKSIKNILEYRMYYPEEEDTYTGAININKINNAFLEKMGILEFTIKNNYSKMYDGRFWFDSVPQIYYQIQNFYNPSSLITEYDLEKVLSAKDYTEDEVNEILNQLEQEMGKKPINTLEEIGLTQYDLSKRDYVYFLTSNTYQKYIYLTLLNHHRIVLLKAIIDTITKEYTKMGQIKNLKYKVPVNESFLSTMLYNYGKKGIEYIEWTYNDDVNKFPNDETYSLVNNYLKIAEEQKSTVYIPEEIWNCLFKNKYIGNQ